MTMRTKRLLTCTCGHEGTINISENDQPFSKSYENYSLGNLNSEGESSYYVEGYALLPSVFEALKPICPQCGAKLSEKNLAA